MSKRKTFETKVILDQVNYLLANSDVSPEYRHGAISVLEQILFQTKNYNGYRYLTAKEVPRGQLPGIRRTTVINGVSLPCEDYKTQFGNTDNTRRCYY